MADSTKWSKGYAVDFLKLLIVWHGNVLASRPCKMMKTVTVTYSEILSTGFIKTQRKTALINLPDLYIWLVVSMIFLIFTPTWGT